MECAYVKAIAEALTRHVAHLHDLELADLVGERLARPGNIAVDFVLDVQFALGRVGGEVICCRVQPME